MFIENTRQEKIRPRRGRILTPNSIFYKNMMPPALGKLHFKSRGFECL
jgi:hypothetical protein